MAGVAVSTRFHARVIEKILSIISVRMAPGANLVSGYLPEGGPGGLHPGHGYMAIGATIAGMSPGKIRSMPGSIGLYPSPGEIGGFITQPKLFRGDVTASGGEP
jgi:hypothetical protein